MARTGALGSAGRRVVAGGLVLLIVGLGIVAALGTGGGGSGPRASSGATSPVTAVPSAADVSAAEACQAFSVYLGDVRRGRVPEGVGRILVRDAGVLLRGARSAARSGRPLPKWASLGADIVAAASDLVDHRAKAFATDGRAVVSGCQAVPEAAARLGGFRRS